LIFIGGIDMETKHNISLTSSEMSHLWSLYMAGTLGICILKYFLEKVEDTEIRSVLEFAQNMANKQVQQASCIFQEEKMPIPYGFTDEDVDPSAPRLYSDVFFIRYLKHQAQMSLTIFSTALSLSSRADIRDLFTECLSSSHQLYNQAVKVMLSKGVYIRSPMIPKSEKVEFVQKQSFLAGFIGDTRPLLASEIAHISRNIETNSIGDRWLLGFSQVAKSREVRQYMVRGKEISSTHVKTLTELFDKDELPVPSTWDSVVSQSTVPPFSDKLMMFHVGLLSAGGIGNYGMGMSMSARRDLLTVYARLLSEVGLYAEDGLNIMIKNAWMEQPPQSTDRKALQRQ
jgi:hypothetical protein